MPFLRKAQRNGARVVVIDPVRSRTARTADWHVSPLPGTDGALALALAHVIVDEGRHDEAWLEENAAGWPAFRERIADYSPDRVAIITGIPQEDIIRLARIYANTHPALIKIADGINRNFNGGQNVRAICSLPALTGQYGLSGGGLAYSSSGYTQWDDDAVNKWIECPPPGRMVNMNRIGAALFGEVDDPPIMSLFVFGANPATSAPNSGRVIEGLKRDDLYTIVHELFMTDTAEYTDLVLPATSQLEQTDLHRAYGHSLLTYNRQAVKPLGECRSNWELITSLAEVMGFDEPRLKQSPDEVIDEDLKATSFLNQGSERITLEQVKRDRMVQTPGGDDIPFSGGDGLGIHFPTPSGKVELYSSTLAKEGLDPLPGWVQWNDSIDKRHKTPREIMQTNPLYLVSAASHYSVSSSFANRSVFQNREGPPSVLIHPRDANERGIRQGEMIRVENDLGWVRLKVSVSEAVRPGVIASPKGHWSKLNHGRNINWTTPDSLADLAGQCTFQSNLVWVGPID
jgi:anaerobic selenocysteine-containing dehydrogenase